MHHRGITAGVADWQVIFRKKSAGIARFPPQRIHASLPNTPITAHNKFNRMQKIHRHCYGHVVTLHKIRGDGLKPASLEMPIVHNIQNKRHSQYHLHCVPHLCLNSRCTIVIKIIIHLHIRTRHLRRHCLILGGVRGLHEAIASIIFQCHRQCHYVPLAGPIRD